MTKPVDSTQEKVKSTTPYKLFFLTIALLFLSVSGIIYYINNMNSHLKLQFQDDFLKIKNQQSQNFEITSSEISTIHTNLDKKFLKIDEKISKTLEDTQYKSNDWIMQKAKYYLDLANINNNWTKDSETTIKLLTAADNILNDTQKNEITEVRKLIAEEILSIKSNKKLDIIKLLAEINAISKSINTMPIVPLKERLTNKKIKAAENSNLLNWQETLKDNLKKLNNLIIIRRNSVNTTKLLSPSYLIVIRENIRLNLQQMQWAILERNQDVYNLSCKQLIDNIKHSLVIENTETQAILSKLKTLKKIDLKYTKIKIEGSLVELNKIIENESQEFRKKQDL